MDKKDPDIDLNVNILEKTRVKLYSVREIQKELEELTEDELDIANATRIEINQIETKRQIKTTFKRLGCPPEPSVDYYSIGRVLGKGGYGKVNLAVHKLTKKLCAVKSINKLAIERNDELRAVNERFMVKEARLRHPNIV